VGSPWRGDTPAAAVPASFRAALTDRGFDLVVDAFPARGFATRFADAAARNAAPDVLVFDNFGVMNGITTPLGSFEGIATDATRRAELIRVTGSFDELLGPARGWTYLFTLSSHHVHAYNLALELGGCRGGARLFERRCNRRSGRRRS
jgi:hypothetical protein